MKLITDKTALLAAFKSIHTRGKKLDDDIWVAAVSAMAHHAKHGDVTIINQLVEAMPKGSRVNALREFIMAHGKVGFDADNQIFTHDKEGVFDLDGAQEKSWTEYKPDPDYKPVDALALVKALAKKISAERKEGDKVTDTQATAILKMASELGVSV
jgi:hypothetical protein